MIQTTPEPAPLDMPVQPLRRKRRKPATSGGVRVLLARFVAFGGAAGLTWPAGTTMFEAISVGRTSTLQYTLLVVFVPTFAWIALSSTSALAGWLPGIGFRRQRDGALPDKTALVMPVYNEGSAETTAGLLAMARGLVEAGHGERFEVFVLSDTNDPEVWMRETAAIRALRDELAGAMPVWYRRRHRNTARKSGNVEDFVKRWGARYDAFVLLDADSVMAPQALVALARELHADRRLALLQTVPQLAGGRGLWARMQQFAGRVYGPVVARGVAAWQGFDGNYWGHNAILRTRAFAESCGLPELRGRKPFGGPILSHDFVEAALLRRAGWAVRMDAGLEGSFEGSPPSLLDVAQRDRRWAQGNLQHSKLVGASGLAPVSRVHLIMGILSYVASPMWLGLMIVGLALAIVAYLRPVDYFSSPFQLFPDWPRFDSARLLYLFGLSLAVLLLPKALGMIRALFHGELRQGCGGAARLCASGLFELVVSSLYAPILMLMQTRQIVEILRGRDSGWNPQRRGDGGTPWGEAIRRHAGHTLVGLGTVALVFFAAKPLMAWMAPTLLGLAFAIPLSRSSGSRSLGEALRGRGLLRTPEETSPPAVLVERDLALARIAARCDRVDLDRLATDPAVRRAHFESVEPMPPSAPGEPDLDRLSAGAKVADARSLEQAWGWMTAKERLVLLSRADWFEDLLGTQRGVERPAGA